MDESSQSDSAAIFMAVISHENPQNLESPEGFRDKVLTFFENGSKNIYLPSFQSQHTSCICTNVDTCFDCLLHCVLSALKVLFEFIEEMNTLTVNNYAKTEQGDVILRDPLKTTLRSDSQHYANYECKKIIEKWYSDAAKQLSSINITDSLVKCLTCGSMITSFLARKTLISGICAQHIQTSQVLSLLKQEYHAGFHFPIPLMEIFRDMMSQRRFLDRHVNCQTFSLLTEIDLQSFKVTQCSEVEECSFEMHGILEYLNLLHKVIKYGVRDCEKNNIQDIIFVSGIVSKVLLPFVDNCFRISKTNKGHLICLTSIKVINTLIDIRFLKEKSTLREYIFKICLSLQSKVHILTQLAEDGQLLSSFNFVGSIIRSSHKNNISVTALKRQMILLALKTFAVTLKGENGFKVSVEADLECFWDKVSCILCCTRDQLPIDWLSIVFADQDDQWITALFCLLVIHKELRKWQSKNQVSLIMDQKITDKENSSSRNMHQTTCPHSLFLQLARFIDYDHLVLADFLTSPETPFLSYFTQYLHIISEDWQGFVSACLRESDVVKVKQLSIFESENCNVKSCLGEEKVSHASEEQSVTLPDTSETDLSVKISHDVVHNNVANPLKSFEEPFSLCDEPLQNVQMVSNNISPSAELLNDALEQSLAVNSHNLQSIALPKNILQTSTTVPYHSLFNPTSMSNIIAHSKMFLRDNGCGPSALSSDILQNSLIIESWNKQEPTISEFPNQDSVSGLCGGANRDNLFSLVVYSDSDSEDSMEETRINLPAKKQNRKRPLSFDSGSDTCLTETHENSDTHKSSSSEGENIVLEHESTSDYSISQYMKCSSEVDSVMGMLIRLRLHVEHLVHSNLFPYNGKPLLLLLEECEELYEKPSDS